jgi:hypothetical protein
MWAVWDGIARLCLHVQRLLGEGHDDVQGFGHVDSRGLVFHVLSLLGVTSLGWIAVGMGLAVLRVFIMYWIYRGRELLM